MDAWIVRRVLLQEELMLISRHIVTGILFITVFTVISNLHILLAIIIFFSSVLIDFDHYLFYVWRKKDISLKNSYKYFRKLPSGKDGKPGIMIFHTSEFFIFILFLSFVFPIFVFILFGMILHLAVDILGMRLNGDKRIFSFILYMIKSINHPERYM